MLTKDLGLTPDMKVLDIACGIGGSAFLMARE
jgi:cyclopropane fatty-acyl-phospholipid synthase-like methyltransferase